jgi:DNA-binding transcriptional LysR family regulator
VQLENAAGAGDTNAPITWQAAAALPLVMLTPEMHNRSIVEEAMRSAGAQVRPALETNSVLALVSALVEGALAAVLPGALLEAAKGLTPLRVRPLVEPTVLTPIGFMLRAPERATPVLRAALELARSAQWLDRLASRR